MVNISDLLAVAGMGGVLLLILSLQYVMTACRIPQNIIGVINYVAVLFVVIAMGALSYLLFLT